MGIEKMVDYIKNDTNLPEEHRPFKVAVYKEVAAMKKLFFIEYGHNPRVYSTPGDSGAPVHLFEGENHVVFAWQFTYR